MVTNSGSGDRLAALKEELAADLRPVRSFHPRRACMLVVMLGFGLGLGMLWPLMGLRDDSMVLGATWLWGPTLLSLAVGASVISVALRGVVPGSLPSSWTWLAWPIFGITLHVAIYQAIHAQSPVPVPEGQEWLAGALCFAMEIALGAPAAYLLLRTLRRGLTAHPLAPAAVGALGTALVADAVWRLICRYSEPAHTLLFHTPGMAAVVLVGVFLAFRWERRLRTEWRSRPSSVSDPKE